MGLGATTTERKLAWWDVRPKDETGKDPAFGLIDEISDIRDKKTHEHQETRSLLQLYFSRPQSTPTTEVGPIISWSGLRKCGFNIMAEALDTGVARLAKPLKSRIVTVGANNSTLRAAAQGNRLIDGAHADNNLLGVGTRMAYDSFLSAEGMGYALWEQDANGNARLVKLDLFDTHISADGDMATTIRYLTKRQAKALLGSKSPHLPADPDGLRDAAIDGATIEHPEAITGVDSSSSVEIEQTIRLHYGWCKPCGESKGREVVQLDGNTVLCDREWKHPVLPVLKFRASLGFRDGEGRPVGRSIAPYAYWINGLTQKLYTQIQAQVPTVGAEEGVTITTPSDVPFNRVTWPKGRPAPIISIPTTVSDHVIQHLDRLREGALRETGQNEATSEGTLPGGIESGIAIREYRTEIAIRLSQQSHAWAEMWEESARILIHLAPVWYGSKSARVRANNTDALEVIPWSKLKLPENSWTVTIQTSGALPDSVAGKLETANTFKEAAPDLIDNLDIAEMFENPDLKAIFEPKLGPRRLIRLQIEKALEEAQVYAPDETQDAAMGKKMAANAHAAARVKGIYPRKNLDALFRLYLLFKDRAASAESSAVVANPGGVVDPSGAAPLAQQAAA